MNPIIFGIAFGLAFGLVWSLLLLRSLPDLTS
jgi:hypothetical protein